MAITQFTTKQLGASSVNSDDVDITTTGKALITKVVAGTNVTISETGVDAGTGIVTINASGGSGVLTETSLADGWSIEGGTASRKLTVKDGDSIISGGISNVIQFPFTGTAIFGKTTEYEIDFGSNPTTNKKFTITDALASTTSKILIYPSGNPATGRGNDDWEWDSIVFAAKGASGTFTLYAKASGRIKGKRKIFYTIN